MPLSHIKKEIWETTYRGIYSEEKLNNYDYDKQEQKFKDIINNPDINLYVTIDSNQIIGYMSEGKPYRPFKDFKQEIGLLYVLKEYQGKGIGKKLFDLAFNSIKDKGYKEFFISCNKYNYNAQQFYLKMGGEIIHIDEDKDDKSEAQVKIYYKID
jgi:ribosomal protein S18 acetylase RimI-like enzyme